MPGLREDAYLDLGFPSRVTETVFDVLAQARANSQSQSHTLAYTASAVEASMDTTPVPTDLALVDRSLLTPSTVRILLARYSRCIKPQYDLLPQRILGHDGLGLKKLGRMDQFCILMACAIAAARQSYRTPSWRVYAHVCRDWAGSLISPIMSAADSDSLTATVLLLIYELADPSRGLVWELVDVAARTCVQLGWHRGSTGASGMDTDMDCGPQGRRLLQALHRINQSLQVIYNRPDLSRIDLPLADVSPMPPSPSLSSLTGGGDGSTIGPNAYSLRAYVTLHDALYGCQGCPFVGDVAACMDRIPPPASIAAAVSTGAAAGSATGLAAADLLLVYDAWLLFLPVCVRHRQCVHCFQEADDMERSPVSSVSPVTAGPGGPSSRAGRGMLSLRRRVLDAAVALVASVYHAALASDGFIPPVVASTRAFVAGCVLATAIVKRWTPVPAAHMQDLVRCTEVLALFSLHWEGGHSYLHVWRTIVDALGDHKTGVF